MTKMGLLFAVALAAGWFVTGAHAQAPSAPAPAPKAATTSAPKTWAERREVRKQQRAAKKAAREVIRKKRVQCFDEAKKKSLTGEKQVEFVRACTDKRE